MVLGKLSRVSWTARRSNQLVLKEINPEEAKVKQFYEDLQDLLELTPKKDVIFISKIHSDVSPEHTHTQKNTLTCGLAKGIKLKSHQLSGSNGQFTRIQKSQ